MSDPIYIPMKHIDVKELGILIPIKSDTYYVYDKHEYDVLEEKHGEVVFERTQIALPCTLDISPRIKAYYNLYV